MSADQLIPGGGEPGSVPPATQVARLRVVHPTGLSWAHVVTRPTTIIGRVEAKGVDAVLTHGTVSRRHFELRWDAASRRATGRDLDSHNGSRIDGHDVGLRAMAIGDGSVLQLGDVCLVLELMSPAAAREPLCRYDDPMPGDSPPMMTLRRAMAQAAAQTTPVLLHGEVGTGKHHAARELHRLARRTGPLVALDCSTLSAHTIERQLFGHVAGAFAGAETDQPGLLRTAAGGTLVLDDVGELPLPLQPKLARALREGRVQPLGSDQTVPIDAWVLSTTRANLRMRVDSGGFDSELYAHLAQPSVAVPPLRERRGDLLAWLQCLHATWLDRHPDTPPDTITLTAEAVECVLLHRWPRNLRDLERLVDELLTAPHLRRPIPRMRLPSWLRNSDQATTDGRVTADVGPPAVPVREPSREELLAIYQRFEGNLRAIARYFSRDRHQVERWLHDMHLAPTPSDD